MAEEPDPERRALRRAPAGRKQARFTFTGPRRSVPGVDVDHAQELFAE